MITKHVFTDNDPYVAAALKPIVRYGEGFITLDIGSIYYLNENGFLDNINDQPALIFRNGKKCWFKDGYYFRENDQPTVIDIVKKEWTDKQGTVHRNHDLPAIIWFGSNRMEWWRHGTRHRSNGPAVAYESVDGPYEEWYIDGLLSRLDGPAYVAPHGRKEWYYNSDIVRVGITIPEELQLAMVTDSPIHIRRIKSPSVKVRWYIIKNHPECIGSIIQLTKEMQEYICINRPDLINQIKRLHIDFKGKYLHELSLAGVEI